MLTRAQFEAMCRALVPDSPEKRRRAAEHARRVEAAAAAAERAKAAELARRAQLARLSEEYEAERLAPFRPDGPRPSGKRRGKLAVGADDHECELRDDDAPPALLDVGDER